MISFIIMLNSSGMNESSCLISVLVHRLFLFLWGCFFNYLVFLSLQMNERTSGLINFFSFCQLFDFAIDSAYLISILCFCDFKTNLFNIILMAAVLLSFRSYCTREDNIVDIN